MNKKTIITILLALAAVFLASCSSAPQWADEEAYEKTVQLNEQYGTLMVGTWYYENSVPLGQVTDIAAWNLKSTALFISNL